MVIQSTWNRSLLYELRFSLKYKDSALWDVTPCSLVGGLNVSESSIRKRNRIRSILPECIYIIYIMNFFDILNPSGRIKALGFTQRLT
jgi:hypothetical protein